MKKLKTSQIAAVAVVIAVTAIAGGTYVSNQMAMNDKESHGAQTQINTANNTTLEFLSSKTPAPNQPGLLEFAIVDKNDKRVEESALSIEHERRMHVIVVSKDLAHFQHVHPAFDAASKTFKLDNFAYPTDGNYRVFADYVLNEREPIVYQDVAVGDVAREPQPLGQPNTSQVVDGTTINVSSKPGSSEFEKTLTFSLSRSGALVTDLENYLGALGHLVVLREGDLEYIHTHALTTDLANQTGQVEFAVDFRKAGTYKAFVQFQRGGKVMTTSYVMNVTGEAPSEPAEHNEHSSGH